MRFRSTIPALLLGTFSFLPASAIREPTQYLPVFGGSGGNAFSRDCGAGRVMTGVRARTGTLLDAVGLLCRPVNSNGTLGQESTVGTLAGGGGGNVEVASCPADMVVTGATIRYGTYVDHLQLHCTNWSAGTRTWGQPTNFTAVGSLGRASGGRSSVGSRCGSKFQPASGIRGRASGLVDALGVVCDEP